ncbi:MAG: hypothetical protein JRN57_01650 [Nitrososphaerota archaeon]|nr:hypothetical protein [Nitrososphaerota archaeon]
MRAGISFDTEVVEALDIHAGKLSELQVDRSEIVNAIIDDFFDGNGTTESVWDAVSKRRIRKRK